MAFKVCKLLNLAKSVSPYILHENDVCFSFGVFTAGLYKKHNIDKYRYKKIFNIPSLLITAFFTGYFPSPSICHKNLRFCWKSLQTIICSLKHEKLIISFFRKKNEKMRFCYNWYLSKNISIYTDISYTYIDISNTIYRYFRYIDKVKKANMPKGRICCSFEFCMLAELNLHDDAIHVCRAVVQPYI